MNGDKKIGVSIKKIEEKLDSGPVLSSEEIELIENHKLESVQRIYWRNSSFFWNV